MSRPDAVLYPLLLLGLAAAPAAAFATDTSSPVTRSEMPADESPNGDDAVRLGDFILHGRVVTSAYYDDNLFATRADTVDDRVFLLSPSFRLDSDWQAHALQLRGGADIARYADHSSENYEDYWLDGKGRYALSENLALFGGTGLRRAHEDRGSEDAVNGREPTLYREATANAGISHESDSLSVKFGGNYTDLDYDDVDATSGEIDNDDRDRSLGAVALRLGYRLDDAWHGYLQSGIETRDYSQTVDNEGFRRSSDGYRLNIGLTTEQTGKLVGELSVGYLQQDYDDARFDTVREPVFNADLKWKAAGNSLLNLHAARSLEETTLSGSPGYLYTRYGARLDQRLTPRLYADVGLTLGKVRYYQAGREDDYTLATAGLAWIMDKRTSLSLDYYFQERDSELREDNYERQRVVASVAVKF